MERPLLILQKNAETSTHKVRIPKATIAELGNKFYMEIYEDKIILRPAKERK